MTHRNSKAVAAKLGGVDTILTLGAGLSGEVALKAIKSAGKTGSIKLGTFDMSPGMLKAAAAGEVEFLIDQQQYLQGYLPIAIFAQHEMGTMPAGVVMTGPGFVTPQNASKVISVHKVIDKNNLKRPGFKARPFFLTKANKYVS